MLYSRRGINLLEGVLEEKRRRATECWAKEEKQIIMHEPIVREIKKTRE